jgi:hypothetical protein
MALFVKVTERRSGGAAREDNKSIFGGGPRGQDHMHVPAHVSLPRINKRVQKMKSKEVNDMSPSTKTVVAVNKITGHETLKRPDLFDEQKDTKKARQGSDYFVETESRSQIGPLKHPVHTKLSLSSPKASVDRVSEAKQTFSVGLKDALSKQSIQKLMNVCFAANHPYVYATAKIESDGKIRDCFLDGATVATTVFDDAKFLKAEDFKIQTKKGTISAASINIYYLKGTGTAPEKLGNIVDLQKEGYPEALLCSLISASEDFQSSFDINVSKVFFASLFSKGGIVSLDLEYASKLLGGLTKEEIDIAVVEILSVVACTELPQLIQPLLSLGGRLNQTARGDNITPLMQALYGKHLAVARELVSAGADVYQEIRGVSAAKIALEQGIEDKLFLTKNSS